MGSISSIRAFPASITRPPLRLAKGQSSAVHAQFDDVGDLIIQGDGVAKWVIMAKRDVDAELPKPELKLDIAVLGLGINGLHASTAMTATTKHIQLTAHEQASKNEGRGGACHPFDPWLYFIVGEARKKDVPWFIPNLEGASIKRHCRLEVAFSAGFPSPKFG